MDKVKEFFESLRAILVPPKAFSWQTLILLSVFSCLMAALASELIRDLLATFGWIFLIFGVGWFTTENPIKVGGLSLGPWITGILVSIFLFGEWINEQPSLLFVSWPLISAAIASTREFLQPGPQFKPPSPEGRQRLVILFLSNLIISCWFQFYFVIQGWLQVYPSLSANDFQQSNFVIRLGLQSTQASTGTVLLNQAEAVLQTELAQRSWPEVERWLLDLKQQPANFEAAVRQQLPEAPENTFWKFAARILPGQPDYTIQMLAIWQGPSSNLQGYHLTRNCLITPTEINTPPATPTPTPIAPSPPTAIASPTPPANSPTPQPTNPSTIKCGPISQPIFGQPEPPLPL